MTTIAILSMPALVHFLSLALDEGYFHSKRSPSQKENRGHALGTLGLLLGIAFLLLVRPSMNMALLYLGIILISCVIMLKDESIHLEACEPKEMRLHGMIYMLHPLAFLSVMSFWPFLHPRPPFFVGFLLPQLVSMPGLAKGLVLGYLAALGLLLAVQIKRALTTQPQP